MFERYMNNWHAIKKEAVIKFLESSLLGLSEKEAEKRLKKYGKNIIKETNKLNPFKIFLMQFKSWLVYILLAAIVISLLVGHYLDAFVIAIIVLLNAFIGFFQQYRAEKSMLELKKMLIHKVKVLRGGKLKIISVDNLVIGDLLVLKSGDKIGADCRIVSSENLALDESILTGESIYVDKKDSLAREKSVISERKNMLYAGTHIVRGNCKAIVVSTGADTEFGKIATMLQEFSIEDTPMQKKMDSFAKRISFFIVGLVAVVILIKRRRKKRSKNKKADK